MRMKPLGRTGVQVSQLCFGTMSFGGDADEAEAGRLYAAAREAGINFFDCANIYQKGVSETILGRLMAHERDSLVITSKVREYLTDDPNDGGLSRRHIALSVEASLKRLGTDRLDVLFMHHWDPKTPIEESLRAIEDLVRAGKVLYVGASNFAAWQIAKAIGVANLHGWGRIDVLQPMYNLVKRQAEVEVLPMAASEEIGVISYSPVGGGLLSGKYAPDAKPEVGRIVQNQMYAGRYGPDWMLETAAAFTGLAQEIGVHPVTLAVAWVGYNPAITSPIIGARSVEQLRPSLAAADFKMDAALHARVSALSPTPPPHHDRLEETISGPKP